jgi:hypothetical protein
LKLLFFRAGKDVVFDNPEMEIRKKTVTYVGDIRIARREEDQYVDPMSICSVTMDEGDPSEVFESDLESNSSHSGNSEGDVSDPKVHHVCPFGPCRAEFRHSFLLTRHLRSVHNSAPLPNSRRKEFPCPSCAKVFGWCTDLKRHLLTHTGERPFKCAVCNVDYNRKFLLDNHIKKKHSDETKDFAVEEPKKSVSSSPDLTIGSRKRKSTPTKIVRVNGERDRDAKEFLFSCEHCDEKFNFRAQYLCHVLSH